MNNFNNGQRYNSPPTGFQPRYHLQSTPREKLHQHNHFQRRSPFPRSPGLNNSNMYIPRNSSPYHVHRDQSRSFNHSSASSPEQWKVHSNQSFSSNSSSSYFGDVSAQSPYNSPRRNTGSPFRSQYNKSFQGRRSFQSSGTNDSNPGHMDDIRLYVHPSMLEDPWKDLMSEIEKKN